VEGENEGWMGRVKGGRKSGVGRWMNDRVRFSERSRALVLMRIRARKNRIRNDLKNRVLGFRIINK
jgi:hypothetical protein